MSGEYGEYPSSEDLTNNEMWALEKKVYEKMAAKGFKVRNASYIAETQYGDLDNFVAWGIWNVRNALTWSAAPRPMGGSGPWSRA